MTEIQRWVIFIIFDSWSHIIDLGIFDKSSPHLHAKESSPLCVNQNKEMSPPPKKKPRANFFSKIYMHMTLQSLKGLRHD